jgi:hypothetical protein
MPSAFDSPNDFFVFGSVQARVVLDGRAVAADQSPRHVLLRTQGHYSIYFVSNFDSSIIFIFIAENVAKI